MTPAEEDTIQRATRAWVQRVAAEEKAREWRDAVIRAACAAGMTKAEAARLAGLSRERVQQIVEGRR